MRYRAVTAAVLVCSAGAAMGQSKAWDGGAGSTDWFADLNWDPDGVPGSADAVLVQGAVPVAQSADIDVRSLLADTGLVLDSRSLYLAEPSSIRNFTLQGCCTRSVVTQGLLTLDGVTTLSKGTIFSGPGGARIAGSATSAELIRVEGTQLTIAGSLVASGDVLPWGGGVVDVTGSLALRTTADLDEVSGGLTRLTGGQIGHLGTGPNDQSRIDARLEANAGLLFADRGILDLRGEYALALTAIEPTEGGQVWFSGSFPNEIEGVTFRGDGTVELRNGSNVYSGLLSAAVESPGSLDVYGTMQLDGLLTVSGNAALHSATVSSPAGTGGIAVGGKLTNVGSSTLRVPSWVQSGGVVEIPAGSLALGADLTIETGGEVLLPGAQASTSITRASGGSTPSLFVHGRLAVPREDGDPCYFRVNTVSVPVELRPGGLIETLDGEVYLIGGGSWTGGTVRAASRCGGRLVFGGIDVTTFIAGDVVARAEQDGRVLFAGLTHTLNVIGTLRTEDLGDAGQTGIEVENVIAIGTGEIRHEQGRMLMHGCDMGTTLINSAELQLAGGASDVRGLLRNDVDVRQYSGLRFEGGVAENTGVWSVEGSGGNQAVGSGGLFTNTGVYMVGDPDGPSFGHNAAVRFDNRGSVVVDEADAVFRDVVQIVGNELTGGDWDVVTTGSITFPGLTVSRVTGQGTRVRGDAASQPWGSDVETIDGGARVESVGDWSFGQPLTIDDGTLEALSGTTMAPKIDIEGSGTLGVGDGAKVKSDDDLDLHSVLGDIQGVIAPGLLPAPATIEAPDTRSHGRVIPGGIARAGQFDFVGDLTLFDDGQLLVDVGGADNTDVITVAGSATLGGTLRVSLIDGFVPEGGESYRLIDTLGGIFNDFAAADLPELPTGLEWEVYVGELFVGLSVVDGCQADWNGDGSVNTQDFLAYLNDWNVQRVMDCSGGVCSADLNGDGTVNTQDFLLFLNFWTSGC